MSSQTRSKSATRYSFAHTAIGLAILIVPLASAWYFVRNLGGSVEDGRALDDSSTDDEGLAYGSDADTYANSGHDPDERPPIIPAVTLNPPDPPSEVFQQQKPQRPEPDNLSFRLVGLAATAAAIASSKPSRRPSRLSSQEVGSSGAGLVNAGTMQVKGIRSVRGDMEDYLDWE